jgi:hypothetical protein
MWKPLVVLALAVTVLSSTGCCWPMHEGRHGYYRDSYSEAPRPPAPRRSYEGRGDGRD